MKDHYVTLILHLLLQDRYVPEGLLDLPGGGRAGGDPPQGGEGRGRGGERGDVPAA